ncbi:MAG: hypothetical protein ACRDY2_14175 [Acidimicrobiales bacterium]
MSTVYRTIFTDNRPDLTGGALEVFLQWLDIKGIDIEIPESGRIDKGSAGVEVITAKDIGVEAVQLRLDEENSGQRWSTILTAIATEDQGWIWIDLERVSDDTYGPPPVLAPPGLVRTFLASSTCRSGSTQLRPNHRTVDEGQVSELIEELLDPDRGVPVIVASRDNADPLGATTRAAALAVTVIGVANVWALDGLATSALSKELGPDLHIFGGAVRTYLPGMTVPDRYPRRHRFARRELFVPSAKRGAQVVARAVVGKALAARPPIVFRNRVALLPGFARQAPDADALLADLLRTEEERDRLQQDLESAVLETDMAASEAEEARARVRWLESRLADAGQYVAGTPTPEDERPAEASSCSEALELAKVHLDLVIVGDTTESADELDQHVKAGTWGRKAWLALRALQSYGRAKASGQMQGNFLQYCRASPSGSEVVPSEWVAAAENETTTNNPRFRRARTFPVPTDVSSDGEAYMAEHIKLEKGSDPAPRLHFWDDTGGKTGKVYVGYLGRHLPSFESN